MDLLQLEEQRQALEVNLQKLRQTLQHWQMWEAEYEGLKEEIQAVGDEPTIDDLKAVSASYDGQLVNEKEIRELSGLDKDSPRSARQILGLIERRQEYVQRNIETVQRQFFETEAKSEELAFATRNHNASSEDNFPLTEIHEELDDDDNVIASHLSQPEESTATLVASLRKAGLNEGDLDSTFSVRPNVDDLKPAITNASPPLTPHAVAFEKRGQSDPTHSRTSSAGAEDLERPSLRKKSVSFTADTKPPEERPRPPSEDGRKSVSFAEKVAVMPAAPPPDTRSVSFAADVEEIPPPPLGPVSPELQAQNGLNPPSDANGVSRQFETLPAPAGQNDAEVEEVIIPEDESPEDARARREMLEYHLNEVGNVVAQIDLEDPDLDMDYDDDGEDDSSSYFTSSEYPEDEDTPSTTGLSESEESEDEFGRTKRRMVSADYSRQMEQLEQKLIGNLGPGSRDEDTVDADTQAEPRRLVVRNKRNSTSSASSDNSEKKSGGKKRVSFAEALDVAEPEQPPPLKAQKLHDGENVVPMAATITERSTATSHSLPQSTSSDRPSRFRKARAAPITDILDDSTASGGSAVDDAAIEESHRRPPGTIIAKTLTERVPTSNTAVAPSFDDPDAALERRELATEYYRRRNDLIKQQGGFNPTSSDEDQDLGELMEERDGKVKKVSRFKAARIKPQ